MLRNGHVRFGGRPAETHPAQARQGAAGRPYTQHRAKDGWVYCAAVIDAFSLRGGGAGRSRTESPRRSPSTRSRWLAGDAGLSPEPWSAPIEERNTHPGSSATGSGKPACSARWAASPPASITRSSSRSGRACSASFLTDRAGHRMRSCRRRCSSGSRASTTRPAGTLPSATSAPWSSRDFTSPPPPRHDQHKQPVRRSGSGSTRDAPHSASEQGRSR